MIGVGRGLDSKSLVFVNWADDHSFEREHTFPLDHCLLQTFLFVWTARHL